MRSRERTRGCCAPGHLCEHSRNSTRNSPRHLAPGSITYSLAPEYSHNETRGPPDHIVSNPRARASASVAAVRPITCTGTVATRPTRSLSQIQDPTRGTRVRLPLAHLSKCIRGCSAPDHSRLDSQSTWLRHV